MEKKKIYLILAGTAAIACVTFFFIFFLNHVGKKNDLAILKNITNNQPEELVDQNKASTMEADNLSPEERQKRDYSKNYLAAKEAKNPGLCQDIGTPDMVENCVLLVARDTLKLEACSGLKDKDKVSGCQNMIHYEKAAAEKSPAECDLISAQGLVNSCVTNLINSAGYARSDCSLFSESARGYCENYHNYLEQMELSMNPKSKADCERIEGEPARSYCFEQFGAN